LTGVPVLQGTVLRRTRRLVAGAAACMAAVTATGCLDRGVFRCHENKQCGSAGYCEATTGACSVADPTCKPSERRYQDHAPGDLSGRCVEDACEPDSVVEVRAGGAHACLVRQHGSVVCWGAGADGQLGDGTRTARSTLTADVVLEGRPVLHVAPGDRHTCALLAPPDPTADSAITCWGANESGQLGDGSLVDRLTPVAGPGLRGVVQLASGAGFTCALTTASALGGTGGDVTCWGRNDVGQLGSVSTAGRAVLPEGALSITARDRHACAVGMSGTVYCWGANSQGELGDGTTTDRPMPTPVAGPIGFAGASAVAAGTAHTCALADGRVWCWGANQVGQLGDGSDESHVVPTLLPTLSGVVALAAGAYHTCASKDDGGVVCWGANDRGQLGEGTTSNIGVPVPTNGIQLAGEVAAGDAFSCARRKDGTVGCWGDNRLGQLGTQAVIRRLGPTPVAMLTDVRAISAGGDHTCALRPSGAANPSQDHPAWVAACWGHNQAGELGDGTRVDRPGPVPLKIAIEAEEVTAGPSHTCVRSTVGGVWCWGRGGSGQLGTPSTIDFLVPASVRDLAGVTGVAAGGAHTCAITGDLTSGGSVRCWGAGSDGQLGDGSATDQPHPPAPLPSPSDVVALRLGAAHSCALRVTGEVACWGSNDRGQLGVGDDTVTNSATPMLVTNLSGVVSLDAGDRHTCAVDGAGQARCWGAGKEGQLGWTMVAVDHAGPGEVHDAGGAIVTGIVEVATGAHHTCARLAADLRPQTPGPVMCWGDNSDGQLGDGTLVTRPLAVPTAGLSDAIAITAGRAHTCALRQDRTVVCWGADDSGQLGEGSPLQFSVPQPTQVPCPGR
jgi:alpha-tubulin suppressor-like RCC1 family protein